MPVSDISASFRDLDALAKQVDLRFEAFANEQRIRDEALIAAKTALEYRLHQSNEFKAQAELDRRTYLTSVQYEKSQALLRQDLDRLKESSGTIAAALLAGVGGGVLGALLGHLVGFL